MRQVGLCLCLFLLAPYLWAGQGKLIATAATTNIEGAAGGGIVPWAVLAGYDSRDETSMSVFRTRVEVDDYALDSYGVAVGLFDRAELSVAHQSFHLNSLHTDIDQKVIGAKVRLYGDLVYSALPQVSVGIQYKRLLDGDIAGLVGAKNNRSGNDIYLAASKVHLGAVAGYNLLWNLTVRRTKANQIGFLGFGGDKASDASWQVEGSLAVLLNRRLAVGIDYRQKPDNLGFAQEDDWADLFLAWFPNKHINVTAAWAELGDIAGAKDQQGLYFSVTGYVW
ncbi:DUF3034 family protein [Pontibacter sp. JAM-7]|uniref:DUF3034 family protein n=1 Tax=Pontibacter sp. JAM-7 TaxID=3366581 RepID=UPI003AF6490A